MARAANPARVADLSRGLRIEYLSLVYNVIEAAVGIAAGIAAGSVALIGFGLDAVVESSSASILIWRLRSERSGRRTSEEAERKAFRLVAGAFFALAAYIGVTAVVDLVRGAQPEDSVVGIALAVASLVIMPVLAVRKQAVASELSSRSLLADSKQTVLCTYLSAVLLVGLLANSLLGWWWADPVAGLAIAALAVDEGIEMWRTQDVCG